MTEAAHLYVSVDDDVQVIRRPPVVVVPVNVALASAGAVASASSVFAAGYPVAAVNDGNRSGAGAGGLWASTKDYPSWAQVVFNGAKKLDRVVVYSPQDNATTPIEPTDVLTFTKYGLVDFTVQGWDGSAWVTLGAPVVGNNLVRREIAFSAYTTDRIRVNVTKAADGYSRLTEIEAWGFNSGTVVTPTTPPAVYVPPTFNFPASLAMVVGAAVSLGQYVTSPLSLVWTPLDTPLLTFTAAGLLTGKAAGSATLNVEVDDGH